MPQFQYLHKNNKLIALVIMSSLILLLMIASLPNDRYCESLDLDCSWFIDGPNKLQHGMISGRDYIYPHGPLSQVIFSAGGLLKPGSPAIDRVPFMSVGAYVVTLILLAACISMIPFIGWRTTLIIITILPSTLGLPFIMRPINSVLAVIVLARAIAAPDNRSRTILCSIAGLLCFIGQLITFEIGVFGMAACTAFIVVSLLMGLLRKYIPGIKVLKPLQALKMLGFMLGTFFLCNLLISLFFKLSSAEYGGLFDYQYYSLELIKSFNYTMVTPWIIENVHILIVLGLFTYCLITIFHRFPTIPDSKRYIYTGLYLLSILQLKSVTVRTDVGHVAIAITPLVFLFLLIAYEDDSQWSLKLPALLLTIALTGTLPGTASWLRSVVDLARNPNSIRERFASARSYEMNTGAIVSDDMNRALERDSVMINFPYENIISIALNRESVTPVLQAFSAHNITLQKFYVDKVSKFKDHTEVTYCLDSKLVDGVNNMTRLPVIYEYLLQNFELKNGQLYSHNCVILHPRQAPFNIRAVPIPFTPKMAGVTHRLVFTGGHACTMLRLYMTVHYPLTSLAGRPVPLSARILSDGGYLPEQRIVPVDVGREFMTYLYPGDPKQEYKLFARVPPGDLGKRVYGLDLSAVEFGPFDVYPDKLEVSKIECVNLTN